MNCLIVEDDPLSRLDLEYKIRDIPFVNLIGSCGSGSEAVQSILSLHVDLIVLDVIMPDTNGFQLIKNLQAERPQIILVSSDKNFAAEAFDSDVTDFLVKPVSNERLFRALIKAKRIHERKPGGSGDSDPYVFIKTNSRLVKIDMRDILFIEAISDYVAVSTTTNKYTVRSSLKTLESMLPVNHFFRTHNSYIVRLDKIAEIDNNCVVIEKKLIPVSRTKLTGLMQKIKLLIKTKTKSPQVYDPAILQSVA